MQTLATDPRIIEAAESVSKEKKLQKELARIARHKPSLAVYRQPVLMSDSQRAYRKRAGSRPEKKIKRQAVEVTQTEEQVQS